MFYKVPKLHPLRLVIIFISVVAVLSLYQSPGVAQSTPPGGTVPDKTGLSPYEIGCRIMGVCPPDTPPSPGAPGPSPSPSPSTPPTGGPLGVWWTQVTVPNAPQAEWKRPDNRCRPSSPPPVQITLSQGAIEARFPDGSKLDGWGDSTTSQYSPSFSFSFVPGCPSGSPPPDGPPPNFDPPGGNPPGGNPPGGNPPGGNPPGGNGDGGNTPGGNGDGGNTPPPPGQNPDKPEEYNQEKPNFIKYAFDGLGKKFPFDVFGNTALPSGSAACPKFTFFTKTFELCIVLQFVQILKIPCVISFVIWSIQSL